MDAFVYMVRCRDGAYYVGSHRGDDPANRVAEHNHGYDPVCFTYTRRPVELVWSERFQWITDAIVFERKLNGWSRAKKEALIAAEWDRVQALARRGVRPASFETPSSRAPQDEEGGVSPKGVG